MDFESHTVTASDQHGRLIHALLCDFHESRQKNKALKFARGTFEKTAFKMLSPKVHLISIIMQRTVTVLHSQSIRGYPYNDLPLVSTQRAWIQDRRKAYSSLERPTSSAHEPLKLDLELETSGKAEASTNGDEADIVIPLTDPESSIII